MKIRNSQQNLIQTVIPNGIILFSSLLTFFFPFSVHKFLPHFELGVLYFWALHYPEKIFLFIIFVAGLVQESLLSIPFGMVGCLYLLYWTIAINMGNYLYKKPFIINWLIFVLLTFFILLIKSIFFLFLNYPFFITHFLWESILISVSYPFISAICFYIYQKIFLNE